MTECCKDCENYKMESEEFFSLLQDINEIIKTGGTCSSEQRLTLIEKCLDDCSYSLKRTAPKLSMKLVYFIEKDNGKR